MLVHERFDRRDLRLQAVFDLLGGLRRRLVEVKGMHDQGERQQVVAIQALHLVPSSYLLPTSLDFTEGQGVLGAPWATTRGFGYHRLSFLKRRLGLLEPSAN